jgi:hypothetical protein
VFFVLVFVLSNLPCAAAGAAAALLTIALVNVSTPLAVGKP